MVPARFSIGKRIREPQEELPEELKSSDNARASWKTLSGQKPRHMSYRARMTLNFALVAGMTVLVLVAVLAFNWEAQFMSYTRSNMERYASVIADSLAETYQVEGAWSSQSIENVVGATSLSSEVGVQVIDPAGVILYDDSWPETEIKVGSLAATTAPASTSAAEALDEAEETLDADLKDSTSALTPDRRTSTAPTNSEALVTQDIVISNGAVIGQVRMWAHGSDALLTTTDAAFRTSSYSAVATAGIIAVCIACFMGMWVSRKLAKPVKSITNTAAAIRAGDLSARTGIVGDDEIGQLGETFDDMATSLERDLKLEHRLTGDVAHELRTPLMAMLATVEAMQDGVLPADEEHLETVAGEVRRLSRLVAAMLQLSRIENGTTAFKPEKTEMCGLVRSVYEAQEQLFADKSLRLYFEAKTTNLNLRKEIYCDVDRDMIRQAIVNLLSNAMRYTPEGGKVMMCVSMEGRDCCISVEDTGMGIAKEDLARVFSRFWRSDASRERESGGLGVGLAVTKEIIDRHHGYIDVESELGKGTKFTLHIPRDQSRSQQNNMANNQGDNS